MATGKAQNGNASGAIWENPASDLAQLWQKAIDDYESKTKKSLRIAPGRSMEEILKRTEAETGNFKAFRHDGGKADKVRTAFKNNMWLIQKVVNTIEIVGAAASVGCAI
jgi:hypothetical protein